MRESLERVVEGAREYPKTAAALVALIPLLLIGLELGEYKAHADDSHRTAAELERVVDGLVRIEERRADRTEARLEAEGKAAKRRRLELGKLCRAGKLDDPDLCDSIRAGQ